MRGKYTELHTLDDVRRLIQEGSNRKLNRLSELLELMDPGRHRVEQELFSWKFRPGDDDEALTEDPESGRWEEVHPGFRLGGDIYHCWFRKDIVIPERVGNFPVRGCRVLLYAVVDYDGTVYINGKEIGLLRKMNRKWHVLLSDFAIPGEIFQIAIKVYKRSWEMTLDLREASLRVAQIQDLYREFESIYRDLEFTISGLRYLPEADLDQKWLDLLERAVGLATDYHSDGDYQIAERKLREAREMLESLYPLRSEYPSIIKGPYLQDVTRTQVTVVWETDIEVGSKLLYGETDKYGYIISSDKPSRIHKVRIRGLSPETRYHYRVGAGRYWSKDNVFKTAVSGKTPFKFVVWGDCDGDPRIHESLVDLMISHEPDLAICTGDIGNSYEQVTRCFFEPIRNLAKCVPVYVAIGNHEYGSVTQDYRVPFFEELLSQPGNGYYFSFDYGNSHFIVLDPHRPYFTDIPPDSEQGRWLVGDLESERSRRATFRFVFIHEPPYSEKWEGIYYDGEPALREHLVPLLERYDVTVVFSGHAHDYERGRRPEDNGPYYIVTGGGGCTLDHTQKKDWLHIKFTYSDYHFCLVEVDSLQVKVSAIDRNGNVFDTFTVAKE